MDNDIRVVAFLKVKPGMTSAMDTAVLNCAMASRTEEGCLFYAGHWDKDDDHHLVFVEHWVSQAALDTHMTTSHFHDFVVAISGVVEGEPKVIILHEIK
ncbi:putative quinol monooxygenase [Acidisoma cladoniae]|jgi:quinol monooxygenase YgiN|uniref:putative quinol monooxygenase n=1 Tax=Acidisoma cladoniae TaxID=3040935 RepID=UPI0025513386|nr:putative quinol monooxygenase [Acidisoma sp. PAMC 29798]